FRGKIESSQELVLALAYLGRHQTATMGKTGGTCHSRGYRFTVQPVTVAADRLERMRERMAVVEYGAQTGFLSLILFDDVRFEPAAPGYSVPLPTRFAGENRIGVSLHIAEKVCIEDHAVFHDLGQPAAIFTVWQRRQHCRVDPYADGLMKRPNQIFCLGVIDPYLAADGAIDHRQERCGNHQHRQAAVERGCHKAGQVTYDAATKGDDQGLAI